MSSSAVQYRRLGRTGLRISVPVLGCMSFGDKEWHNWLLPEEQALPVLKAAWDRGINTFDTANMYSNGESERILGRFIKKNGISRELVVIITKIRFLVDHKDKSTISVQPSAWGLHNQRDYINQDGLSRAAIFNQLNASLARLQMDYIDILMIHMPDSETPYEETMCALNDIVRSGKARYLAASNIRAWQLAEMNAIARHHGWTEFSCVQLEHSLLYRTEEAEMIPYCDYKGLGIISFSPVMNGVLARPVGIQTERVSNEIARNLAKKVRPSDEAIIRRVEEIAKKHGWSMAQVALAWSITKVSSPVIGATTTERVEEDLIGDKVLTSDEVKYLEELYEVQAHRF